jgi:hypothetical protein
MANSYFAREQNQSARSVVRCPYCVEAGNFRVMTIAESGDGHMCNQCGHMVLPSNTLFECACKKCARFRIA